MKVGTDGVLLGAWAPLHNGNRILDVGTGSGLIALMLAQRFPTSTILGIDIDTSAVSQARENVAASPFANRVAIEGISLQELEAEPASFDAIVCNPPFFEESLLSPDAGRTVARHTTNLPFVELIQHSARLLKPDGCFCVILPTTSFDSFHLQCFALELSLAVRCDIQTSPGKAPKRTMACFQKAEKITRRDELLVLTEGGQRSAAYSALTREFYIK